MTSAEILGRELGLQVRGIETAGRGPVRKITSRSWRYKVGVGRVDEKEQRRHISKRHNEIDTDTMVKFLALEDILRPKTPSTMSPSSPEPAHLTAPMIHCTGISEIHEETIYRAYGS